MTVDRQEKGTSDTLISALMERLSARIELSGSTARLALTELHVATVSVGQLLLGFLVLSGLILTTWLIVLAAVIVLLMQSGWSIIGAIVAALVFQLIACTCLVMLIMSLSRRLRFNHTRQALHGLASSKPADPEASPTTD